METEVTVKQVQEALEKLTSPVRSENELLDKFYFVQIYPDQSAGLFLSNSVFNIIAGEPPQIPVRGFETIGELFNYQPE